MARKVWQEKQTSLLNKVPTAILSKYHLARTPSILFPGSSICGLFALQVSHNSLFIWGF